MRKIRDFKCEVCGDVFEAWVEDDVRTIDCQFCGSGDTASRCVSAGRYLGNTTGKSPSLSNRNKA